VHAYVGPKPVIRHTEHRFEKGLARREVPRGQLDEVADFGTQVEQPLLDTVNRKFTAIDSYPSPPQLFSNG
jgi:hypothetical protein